MGGVFNITTTGKEIAKLPATTEQKRGSSGANVGIPFLSVRSFGLGQCTDLIQKAFDTVNHNLLSIRFENNRESDSLCEPYSVFRCKHR